MFRKFHSIEQFRHVVRKIRSYYKEDLPTIRFSGTIKLHGTNGCVGYKNDEIFIQSRSQIITIEKDNYGFAQWVEDRKKEFINLFQDLIKSENLDNDTIIYLYGEFAGKGIQKGVGISHIEKSFFIFDICLVKNNTERFLLLENPFVLKSYKLPQNVYSIYDFKCYTIDIDFNDPEVTKQKLDELTKEVESECPVAKELLSDIKTELVGEGIVWRSKCGKYIFKTKGEKHSKSKSKTIKKLSKEEMEKLNKIERCVEEVFSIERCNQALIELFGPNFEETIDIKKIGDYLRLIMKDTVKEEYDILEKYNLTIKDISKQLSSKVKKYFTDIAKS